MPREREKKIFVSLTPRLRHDCVISNDVGSVARKGSRYDHERFHSRQWRPFGKRRMAATNNSLIADVIRVM